MAAPAAIYSNGSPRLRFDPDAEIHVNRSDVDLIMEPLGRPDHREVSN
ncbi:hypothetical protein [Caballeronia sp. NCTM5]|nr:hypothetical protein [Caballeronia sp. NCTM5]